MRLALVALLLGLFVVRPLLAGPARADLPRLAPPARLPEPDGAPAALSGEIDDGTGAPGNLALIHDDQTGHTSDGGAAGRAALQADQADPVERLRALIGERKEETVEILRNWLEGEEEIA